MKEIGSVGRKPIIITFCNSLVTLLSNKWTWIIGAYMLLCLYAIAHDKSGKMKSYFSNSHTVTFISSSYDTSYHSWTVTMLTMDENETKLFATCYPKCQTSSIWIEGNEYIEDCDTRKRYYIKYADIENEPDKTYLYTDEPYSFWEYYPALPPTTKRINIVANNFYYIKNLKIR